MDNWIHRPGLHLHVPASGLPRTGTVSIPVIRPCRRQALKYALLRATPPPECHEVDPVWVSGARKGNRILSELHLQSIPSIQAREKEHENFSFFFLYSIFLFFQFFFFSRARNIFLCHLGLTLIESLTSQSRKSQGKGSIFLFFFFSFPFEHFLFWRKPWTVIVYVSRLPRSLCSNSEQPWTHRGLMASASLLASPLAQLGRLSNPLSDHEKRALRMVSVPRKPQGHILENINPCFSPSLGAGCFFSTVVLKKEEREKKKKDNHDIQQIQSIATIANPLRRSLRFDLTHDRRGSS